jgi:hypothetical protein
VEFPALIPVSDFMKIISQNFSDIGSKMGLKGQKQHKDSRNLILTELAELPLSKINESELSLPFLVADKYLHFRIKITW